MKKRSQVLIVLVALGITFGCATVGFGQGRVPMVGSYNQVATSDPGADASADKPYLEPPTANHSTQPAASVAGVYENFTVGKGSGDLEGMRVVIVQAGGGYHAIVQVAQGGAEDPQPEFVDVNVNGMSVGFTAASMKYTGTVMATGLKLKDADGATQTLVRKPCASYFR